MPERRSASTTPLMTTPLRLHLKTKSKIQVQRKFRTTFHKAALCRRGILSWYRRFLETGSDRPRRGRPRTSDDGAERSASRE
ncbi:hypothetical protein AVEN_188826-1 [Araneus ventricosus]|uniref:DUF4817 domain-containing protein n=1 Tax=Araneus ventricosus TaxID=182803 RepID=A0A4Y2BUD9_ARAVE|nr:hypothetical protein AVEN_188826-1 [Araneus ventricosus]